MARTWNVSILLLKKDRDDPQTVFGEQLAELEAYEVNTARTAGTLYVSTTESKPPEWTRLFAGETDRPITIERPNFGAVFLTKASRRTFAVTFGTGRWLLDVSCYERRFGLKAALNLVDPAALRSAQSRVLGESALHVHRQTSRVSAS